VAKAYGVRKVVMFDIEQPRVDFAVKYGADAGIVPPRNEQGVEALAFAQDYAKQVIKEYEIGSGFDVTVEASGAEACAQMAICMLKNGGTCESHPRRLLFSGRVLTVIRYPSRSG
jgi:D-xylulose reductase